MWLLWMRYVVGTVIASSISTVVLISEETFSGIDTSHGLLCFCTMLTSDIKSESVEWSSILIITRISF